MRSVAGQVLFLQTIVAVVLITAAIVALAFHTREDGEEVAQNRALAAAEAFSDAPRHPRRAAVGEPRALLQPATVRAAVGSGLDFIVVMSPEGERLADSDPELVGTRAEGVERAAAGEPFTEIYEGEPEDAARDGRPRHRRRGPGGGPARRPGWGSAASGRRWTGSSRCSWARERPRCSWRH